MKHLKSIKNRTYYESSKSFVILKLVMQPDELIVHAVQLKFLFLELV